MLESRLLNTRSISHGILIIKEPDIIFKLSILESFRAVKSCHPNPVN
jgi:hypothetical protein